MKKLIFAAALLGIGGTAMAAPMPTQTGEVFTQDQVHVAVLGQHRHLWKMYKVIAVIDAGKKIVLADIQGDVLPFSNQIEKQVGNLTPGETVLVQKHKDMLVLARVPGLGTAMAKAF